MSAHRSKANGADLINSRFGEQRNEKLTKKKKKKKEKEEKIIK